MSDVTEINFLLVDVDGEVHDEDEIALWGEFSQERLAPFLPLLGQLLIKESEVEEIGMQDHFNALLPWMCLEAPLSLAAGNPYKYSYANCVDFITLTPKDNIVTVTDSDGDIVAEFQMLPLLNALVDCGERYVAFKEREWKAKGENFKTKHLIDRVANARAAIDSGGLGSCREDK